MTDPALQYRPEYETPLGLGLYHDELGEVYIWFGPDWPNAWVEWITWGSCATILLLTAFIIFRRLCGKRFLPGVALPIAAASFTIGIMHVLADDGDGDISDLRILYTMPAFTLYCCWMPLRNCARRTLWWLLDLAVLALTTLSFYASTMMFDLREPLRFIIWLIVWIAVRWAIRDGRLASPAGGRPWRFLILAHAVALSFPAIGLLTNTVLYEEFVYVIALLTLPALSLGVCVFLLSLFQMGKQRVSFS
jgi:hypothetical protein